MKYLSGFGQFIGESSRLLQLGLIGLNNEQKEFLDECIKGSWEFDLNTGLVNIQGDFNCSFKQLTGFKSIRFGNVSGNFSCYDNQLTSLEGAPQQVGGWFDCGDNRLKSLEGAPQRVGGGFYCGRNRIMSLEGAPQEVEGNFDCKANRLTSLLGAPQRVGGSFDCTYNLDLQSLAGLPKLHAVEVPKHLEERLELMREAADKLKSEE